MRTRLTFCTILLAALWTQAASGETLWIETERFDQCGGWTADAQFIDQMGSPYLMAIGLGKPVADATTRVHVERPGRYRLWARTKDWVPEHHPGVFQVCVNGRTLATVFGRSGKSGWHWEDGGECDLEGELEIGLQDLSGYYARCDAVLLTDELDFVPPDDVESIAELRERHGGVSAETITMPKRDVIVIGGGLAGCTAAVAAARGGAETVLLQNRPVLGGNASSEILVPPVGAWAGIYRTQYPLDPRETGLIDEYRTAGNQRVTEGRLYSNRLLRFVRLEPNLDLRLNTHATGVEMHPGPGKRIAAVLAVDVRSGRRMRFPASFFIDCTGDSVVGVAAGAEYRHGKEPKSQTNEPWAPDEPSRHTMGNGLKYFGHDAGSPKPFEAPPWGTKFPTCEHIGPGRHPKLPDSIEIGHQWCIELGGTRDTYADAEAIRDDLLCLVYGLWDHLKNHCPKVADRAAGFELSWVGYVAGKRENRRLVGDYVLTQNDIADQTLFTDRVAFGAWSVDDHYSAGFFHDGPTGRHHDTPEHHYRGHPFSIPFRSLYSRNVENLLMAGRNISATHLGMANTRVMLTCAILGHAVGTGSALCVELETSPRNLVENQNHLKRLQQQLLKEGATIFELAADDPLDLARRATASASNERTHTSGERMVASNVINGFARAVGFRMNETTNAWGPVAGEFVSGEIVADDSDPYWVALTWPEPVTFNVVHLTFQTADLAPSRFAIEVLSPSKSNASGASSDPKSDSNAWQPVVEVTENRHRRHVLGLDRVTASGVRVVLDEPAAVCEIRVYDEPPRVVEIARRAHCNMRLPDEGPWLPWGDDPADHPRSGRAKPFAVPTGIDPSRFEGVVLDDSQAKTTGNWVQSTYTSPFILGGYSHDGNEGKGAKSIRFSPRLESPGKYEVRLGYVAFQNRATNAPVTVHAPGGATTLKINQRKPPPIEGHFLSLGTFELAPSGTIIELTNTDTDGYVVVDAVQILPAR